MHERSDLQLLQDYAEFGRETAFREIVARYTDLVYSAALRQVESPHTAADITQSVFVDLARKARALGAQLPATHSLAGWLHRATRYLALNHLRDAQRRIANERQAMEQLLTDSDAPVDWQRIRPDLDEALDSLGEDDRQALLLRYFKNQDLRAVGQQLGVSDDAAQKRVSRAVERLREFFAKRGVSVGAGGLAIVISANAVQAAPAGLVVTISATAALAGPTIATTAIATNAIVMTTLQKTLIAATLVAAVGTGIYEARRASQMQGELQLLQQQHAPLADQLRQLTSDHATVTEQLAALRAENEQLRKDRAEFPKLRGELARLRSEAQAAAQSNTADTNMDSAAKSWLNRVNLLKQRLEQMPGAKIPELQFVTDRDWLNAAMANFDTEEDYRRALSGLRSAVENKFVAKLQPALRKYLEANGQEFPTDVAQLQAYFESPVDDALLQRYTVVPAESLSHLKMGGDWIITQKTAVDEEYDSRWGIGPNGFGTSGGFKPQPVDALVPALAAFAAANNGRDPIDPAQLLPYIKTPEEQAALKKLLQNGGAGASK